MNFPDQFLPFPLLWVCNAIGFLVLGIAAYTAPWKQLQAETRQHLWLGMCVGLLLLWSIKTGIKPGLNFHLLGATLMTLMFGARLAIVAFSVVLLGSAVAGLSGWETLGVNLLLSAILPVTLSYALYSLADRKLPHHLFIYIFLNAFVAGGLAMMLDGISSTLLLSLSGVYSSAYLMQNYLPYYLLMSWSEAMVTGMLITLITAFRPHWLSTFSDELYLKRRG